MKRYTKLFTTDDQATRGMLDYQLDEKINAFLESEDCDIISITPLQDAAHDGHVAVIIIYEKL